MCLFVVKVGGLADEGVHTKTQSCCLTAFFPFSRNRDMDFACRRHDILITPHKRNEVERSVGW